MKKLTVGSCFSGIGGIEKGLEDTGGFEIKWQCEKDPYARKVLRRHWPETKIYDDILDISGKELEPVNLVCGGSPCQDLSIANKQAHGLAGTKSGLFYEFARICDEVNPTWILFENVPNLLSINQGMDFSIVLYHFTGYFPKPPADGYDNAGVCVGARRGLAWRVLDAQYFGVAQRRRRVFIVASPRKFAPAKVLFNEDSCRWDDPQERKMGEIGLCISTRDGDRQDPKAETLIASCIKASDYENTPIGQFGNENNLICSTILGSDQKLRKFGFGENIVAQTIGAAQRGSSSFVWQDTHIAEAVDKRKRAVDGVSHWSQRSRCLGNAVVPAVARRIGEWILKFGNADVATLVEWLQRLCP